MQLRNPLFYRPLDQIGGGGKLGLQVKQNAVLLVGPDINYIMHFKEGKE